MKLTPVLLVLLLLTVASSAFNAAVADTATGQVVDPSGNPVSGATVYIFNYRSMQTPEVVTTAADGSFHVDLAAGGAMPTGLANRFAQADFKGFAPSCIALVAGNKNRIQLSSPVTITGTVVDAAGNPVAGASLSVQRSTGSLTSAVNGFPDRFAFFLFSPFKERLTTKTDAHGAYSLVGLPSASIVSIMLDDPKYAQTLIETPLGALSAPPITAQLGAYITGKVVRQDGKPVVGVSVMATLLNPSSGFSGLSGRAQVATDGTYKFTSLTPGKYRVGISPTTDFQTKRDWAPAPPVTVTAGIVQSGVAPDLVLTPGVIITGTIVDATSHQPIPGVEFGIQDPQTTGPVARYITGMTDSQGQISVIGWPGTLKLFIYSVPAGYASEPYSNGVSFTVVDGQPLKLDPVLIQRGLTATGRVTHDDGTPTGQVSIQLMRIGANGASFGQPEVSTKTDGSYTLSGLLEGQYTVTVAPDPDSDWSPPRQATITVTADKPVAIPNLVMTKGATVTGEIIDSVTKKPVAGVGLGIQDPSENRQPRSINITTDANGKFAAHIWPGPLELFVYNVPSDYANVSADTQRSFTVTAGQVLALAPIPLGHALSVSGTVVDDSRTPVSDVKIQLQKVQNDGTWMSIPSVSTDKNGVFKVGQLVPGTYYIDAGADWQVVFPSTIEAPSTDSIRISLKKSIMSTVQGTAVDSENRPLNGVTITFQTYHVTSNGTDEGDTISATTDSNGFFSVTGVFQPNSLTRQSVTKDGYAYRSGGDISSAGDRPNISLIVMAKQGATVTGIVRNGLNAPVAGAYVCCPDGTDDVRPIPTDSTGHFTIKNLVTGPVTVYAAKGKYFGQVATTAGDTPTDVTVTLAPMTVSDDPGDVTTGTQMLSKLYADCQTWGAQTDVWRMRDSCAQQVSLCSINAGFAFLKSLTTVNSGDLSSIYQTQDTMNPVATALWAMPIMQSVPDNGYLGRDAVDLGLAVAPYDQNLALTLYDLAAKHISLTKLTNNGQETDDLNYAMELTALAYALHRPDADVTFQTVSTAIKALQTQSTVNSGYDWLMANFVQQIALGDVDLCIKLLPSLTTDQRNNSVNQIVSELIKPNPTGAVAVFHTLDQNNSSEAWVYDQSLVHVLPIIFKSDPKGALDLAQGVNDPTSRCDDLKVVADLVPLAQAAPLYAEAETDSIDQDGPGEEPASVAAHALLRDKTLGAKLFQQAFDKLTSTEPTNQYGGPSYAGFAFYYSRLDPGYSRLLIENQFEKDRINPPQYGEGVTEDVAAMSAIDIDRAETLANSIKNPDDRFNANLLICERVLQDQKTRDTISFNVWGSGSGWTPDSSAPW